VLSTIPVDGDTAVAINSNVSAIFSEVMDPLSITPTSFTLRHGTTSVLGDINYSGSTALLNPVIDLEFNTLYTATITTGAKDLSNNGLASNYVWTFRTVRDTAGPPPPPAPRGPSLVNLNSAGNYAILGGSTITNVISVGTIVTGNVGLYPGVLASITGLIAGPGVVVGTITAADTPGEAAILIQAKLDLTNAYNDARDRALSVIVVSDGELGGKTLEPGLYISAIGSFAVTSSDVTLTGNVDDTWIFQCPSSTFKVLSNRKVILAGAAQDKNIFWSVGTSATLGTYSETHGNILADQAITLETGAKLYGRALTRIAAVTLDASIVTKP